MGPWSVKSFFNCFFADEAADFSPDIIRWNAVPAAASLNPVQVVYDPNSIRSWPGQSHAQAP